MFACKLGGGNRILMVSYISRRRQKEEPLNFIMWGSERHAQKDFVSLRGFIGYVEIELQL